jgi:hypothetical protein
MERLLSCTWIRLQSHFAPQKGNYLQIGSGSKLIKMNMIEKRIREMGLTGDEERESQVAFFRYPV